MNNESQEDRFQEDVFQETGPPEKESQQDKSQQDKSQQDKSQEKDSREIAAQLSGIRKILSFGVWCFAVMAVTQLASNVYYIADDIRENKEAVMGRTYYSQSDYLASEKEWDEVLKLAKARQLSHPRDAQAFWFEGIAYYYLERWDDSIAAFKKAVEINPAWEQNSRKWIELARKRKLSSKTEQLSS